MPVPAPISRTSVAPSGINQSSASLEGAGPEPVVLVGHLTEGAAQDGRGLVLAHGRQSTGDARSTVGRVGWAAGAVTHQARGCVPPSDRDGRRDNVVAHAEVAQW